MAKYTVQTTLLDRIDHSAGFKDDGSPKKIVTHNKGDEVEFEGYDDDQVQRLVDLGAVKPADAEAEEETPDSGQAAVDEFLTPAEAREQPAEASAEEEASAKPAAPPAPAAGAVKKAT